MSKIWWNGAKCSSIATKHHMGSSRPCSCLFCYLNQIKNLIELIKQSPVKLKFAHFQLSIDALIITVLEIIPDSFEFVRLNGMKQKNLPFRASYHVKTTSILDPNIQNYSEKSTAEHRFVLCWVGEGKRTRRSAPNGHNSLSISSIISKQCNGIKMINWPWRNC